MPNRNERLYCAMVSALILPFTQLLLHSSQYVCSLIFLLAYPFAELKCDRSALLTYKQKVEEWDAKQSQWQLLHDELATANGRILDLEAQLAEATASLKAHIEHPTVVFKVIGASSVRKRCVCNRVCVCVCAGGDER